jgi:hypothetical protein
MELIDKVEPIRITDNDTGKTYELDFSRESVKYMARQGFKVGEDIVNLVAVQGPEFFWYAFRKNHKEFSRGQAEALYEKMGGLSPKLIERLAALYNQALMSNNILQDDEDLEKNARVTVEL